MANVTLRIKTLYHYGECIDSERRILYVVMLSTIMLSIVMLSIVMLSVVMFIVVKLSVVAPFPLAGKQLV